MKTTEQKQAEKIVYNYLRQKAIHKSAKLRVDKRKRVGKLALQMVYKIEKTFDFEGVKNKRKQRHNQKPKPFTNILQNPIVKDYINNKQSIKQILNNRLVFWGGRNHWAKSETDLRVLSILKNKNLK